MCSVSPSTDSILPSAPAGIAALPTFSAVHDAPRYSMRVDFPGSSSSRDSHELMNVAVDRAVRPLPQLRIDLSAHRRHRGNRERRKQQPLKPGRQVDAEHANEPDDDRRGADEDQEELRVDREQLDSEQQRAEHEPSPPLHCLHLAVERPGVLAAAIIAAMPARGR